MFIVNNMFIEIHRRRYAKNIVWILCAHNYTLMHNSGPCF